MKDLSAVEVDRYPFGTTMFSMSTARLERGSIVVTPQYPTAGFDPSTTFAPDRWYECRVYDEADRIVAHYVNPTPPERDRVHPFNDATGYSHEAA